MKKFLSYFLPITGILLFAFGMFWISIGDELYYWHTAKYSTYTFAVTYQNGSTAVITTKRPTTDTWFQLNSYDHKGKHKDLLQCVWINPNWPYIGGHWITIEEGVIGYELLKKEPVE